MCGIAGIVDLSDRPAIYRRIQRVWQDLEGQHFAQATACYYASCTMIDDQVGRILAVLDELGMTDNTLIVFASDHGDYLGAHHLFLKGIPTFEEAYRVPLIIKGPGVPGRRDCGGYRVQPAPVGPPGTKKLATSTSTDSR